MKFNELLQKTRRRQPEWVAPATLLAIDPGETIGWSQFNNGELSREGQIMSKENPEQEIIRLFDQVLPTVVVCENYKMYADKKNVHIGMELFTPKMIGMIQLLCFMRGIPLYLQMASTAKGWCTDDKLKMWGYYIKGHRHSRDSIRHGAYWLLFYNRR